MVDFWFNSEESVAATSATKASSRPATASASDESSRERLQKLKALLFDMFAIEARPPVDLVLDYLDLVYSVYCTIYTVRIQSIRTFTYYLLV